MPPRRPRFLPVVALLPAALTLAACGRGATDTATPPATQPDTADAVVALVDTAPAQSATVGAPFTYDATRGNTVFASRRGRTLTHSIAFSPAANGLTASAGRVSGVPRAPGIVLATITASDGQGGVARSAVSIVAFAAGLAAPRADVLSSRYADADVPLPAHFLDPGPAGGIAVVGTDATPATNPVTNAGAALGRVLFYDPRLSANDGVSCASCHAQQFAFSDTARFSRGFRGGRTARHSMGLSNARFYGPGRYFWDERAATLEAQVLRPVQDTTEMGMTLDALVLKLGVTSYYPGLFAAAFGTPEITSDRIARALAQFVRSLTSYRSRFDQAAAGPPPVNFRRVLTAEEEAGRLTFTGPGGCAPCHATLAQVGDNAHNTGLDATVTDAGAGGGRFKSPSLRNVAVRAPYMHDGRFATLRQVVDFYDAGVQASPNLDPRLRAPGGAPRRLNLSVAQKDALVAFLRTLTDSAFLNDPRLSSPFEGR